METNITDADAEAQLAKFTDKDSVNSWAKISFAVCIKYGIAVGNNDQLAPEHNITRAETRSRNIKPGFFIKPEDNITRAETSALVMRLLQKANLI